MDSAQCRIFALWISSSNDPKARKTEQTWLHSQSKESQLTGFSNALLTFMNGILVCVVFLLVTTAIDASNADNPEALVALVIFCVMASAEILMPIGIAFLHLGQLITAAERLNDLIEQRPLVEFNGSTRWQKIAENQPLVRFEKVTFNYPQTIKLH